MYKLKKLENNYYSLYDLEGDIVTSNNPKTPTTKKLSLRNCEEIELGFSLVELFDKVDSSIDYHEFDFCSFRLGVKAVLELLGDKKFSEDDVRLMLIDMARFIATKELRDDWDLDVDAFFRKRDFFIDKQIQSLQQTEWDVEICCYIGNGDKESDSFKDPIVTNTGIPKLDSDGCLILKRK